MTSLTPLRTDGSRAMQSTPASPASFLSATFSNDAVFYFTLIAIYLASFSFVASTLRQSWGFPLDDSWIGFSVARNLGQHGGLGYVHGKPSSGATSLLWMLLLAAKYRFLPSVDPVLYNLALSTVLFPLIGILLFTCARQDGMTYPEAFVFAACAALNGNLIWLTLLGMEQLLLATLVVAAIVISFCDVQGSGWRETILLALLCGSLCLTRPEAVLFVPVLFFVFWRRRRNWQQLSAVAAVTGAFLSFSLFVNWITSHSLLPNTYQGRMWLYFDQRFHPELQLSLYYALSWLFRILALANNGFNAASPLRWILLHVFLIVSVFAGIWWIVQRRCKRLTTLVALCLLHFGVYAVEFPSLGQGSRYQPLMLMATLPLMAIGIYSSLRWAAARIASREIPQAPAMALMTALIFVTILGLGTLRFWRYVSSITIAHINRTHGEMGQWLNTHIPRTEKVAVFDFGTIGYMRDEDIVDIGGLSDKSVVRYLFDGRIPEYLQEQNVKYIVLPDGDSYTATRLRLLHNPRVQMTKIALFCSPPEEWAIGWHVTANASRCQAAYALTIARQ